MRTRILAVSSVVLAVLATAAQARAEVRPLRIEGQSFTVAPAGAGRFVTGSSTGAPFVGLWSSSAVATTSFQLDAPRDGLTVVAWADECEGWPEMLVSVDGFEIGSANVATSISGSYQFDGTWPAGSHWMSVKFLDDHSAATCDRSLKVHAAIFGEPTVVANPVLYVSPHDFDVDPTAGTFFNWGERGQPGMVIWSDATASTEVWLQRATRIVLVLGNDRCEGWPRLAVRVDGATLSEFDVPFQHVSTTIAGDWGAGWHALELEFVNDLHTTTCDRNVKLYEMWLDAPPSG